MARVFENISSKSWVHALDLLSKDKLPVLPNIEQLGALIDTHISQEKVSSWLGAHATLYTEKDTPLAQAYALVLERLDPPEQYPLYLLHSTEKQAFAAGIENHFVAITSTVASQLSVPELCFILGHEVSHIMSKHVRYKTLANFLTVIPLLAPYFPLAVSGQMALGYALSHWNRMSEYSADRAGLLACQDIDACKSAFAFLLQKGKEEHDGLVLQRELEQKRAQQEWGDYILQIFFRMHATHPDVLSRLEELDAWVDTEEYKQILSGTFDRRDYPDKRAMSDIDFLSWKQTEEELAPFEVVVEDSLLDSTLEDAKEAASKLAYQFTRWIR